MKTPEEKIVKMQELFLEGHSVRFIAENLNMGKTTVRDKIKRLKLERPIDVPPKYYPDQAKLDTLMERIKEEKRRLHAQDPDLKVKF